MFRRQILYKREKIYPIRLSTALLLALIFGLIGGFLLRSGRAVTPAATLEAEFGTLSDGAALINDQTASGGASIKFASDFAPVGDITGWKQVFIDDFNTTLNTARWTQYAGCSQASRISGGSSYCNPTDFTSFWSQSHVYTQGGMLHLLGKSDASGIYGTKWYTGGTNIQGAESWVDSKDVKVSFRWKVTNTQINDGFPKYAFLRWPGQQETRPGSWPIDGEEDFLEGPLRFTSNPYSSQTLHWGKAQTNSCHSLTVPFGSIHCQGFQSTLSGYDPAIWHTVSWEKRGYDAKLIVDGAVVYHQTSGSDSTHLGPQNFPDTFKHIVFQQECESSGCPTSGVSDIQIDWVTIYRPL